MIQPIDNLPTQSAPEFQIEIADSFASLLLTSHQWDQAVEQLGASLYMTYDWLRTWWEFYGGGHKLSLFVARHDGIIVALLPIYIEAFGIGPWKTNVARIVGANLPPKTFNPPVHPQWAEKTFSALFLHLFHAERCDLLSLGPVSRSWSAADAFGKACAASSADIGSVRYQPYDVQTRFTLPPTFDAYLASLGSSERKNRLKRQRKLEKAHSVTSDIISDPLAVQSEFESFSSLHTQQWHAVGKGGHFKSWPRAEDYNRTLVARMAECGRVRFFRMLVDGETAASRYTFLFGNCLYSELPARKVGDPWDGLGIGGTSLLKFNEAAIAEGINLVDSGLGGYEHKSQLGGEQIPVGVWRVAAPRLSHRIKAAALLAIGKGLRLVFHQLWYRRLSKRIPGHLGRTQARFWLRFDM